MNFTHYFRAVGARLRPPTEAEPSWQALCGSVQQHHAARLRTGRVGRARGEERYGRWDAD